MLSNLDDLGRLAVFKTVSREPRQSGSFGPRVATGEQTG